MWERARGRQGESEERERGGEARRTAAAIRSSSSSLILVSAALLRGRLRDERGREHPQELVVVGLPPHERRLDVLLRVRAAGQTHRRRGWCGAMG